MFFLSPNHIEHLTDVYLRIYYEHANIDVPKAHSLIFKLLLLCLELLINTGLCSDTSMSDFRDSESSIEKKGEATAWCS